MLKEATRYCELIEHEGVVARGDLVEQLRVALGELFVTACRLPTVEPDSDHDVPDVSHQDWHRIYLELGPRLDADYYWSTRPLPFDPARAEPEFTIGSLCDDLADIWQDLTAGLRGRETRMTENDVLWHWKFSFESHWGQHAVDALRVLHALMAA